MKRVIYAPALDEIVPTGAVYYTLPVAGAVVDALVADDWLTDGVVFYNTDPEAPVVLAEPFKHHFAGWEVSS